MEPFVMSSIDRAQQWVDLCSKGMTFPKEECASMLASMCGFGSWDVMTYAIETLPPSQIDEALNEHLVADRVKSYLRVLVGKCEVDPPLAMFLLAQLPPSSRQPYTPFTMAAAAEVPETLMKVFESFTYEFASTILDNEDEMQRQPWPLH